MNKYKKTHGKSEEDSHRNPIEIREFAEIPGNQPESELLRKLDNGRRSFLKKLLISAAYVTPAILTLSMKDLEAKQKRPTNREKSRKRMRK